MANVSVSVIIPCKNIMHQIGNIIIEIAEELKDTEAEFIVIDMNSSDESVIRALEVIKKQDLRGCVIQSGGGSISSALNTGIYKSDGKYITLVHPGRRYKNYIPAYLDTADETGAEFIIAKPSGDSAVSLSENVRRKTGASIKPNAAEVMSDLIYSRIYFDFYALVLKREFVLRHHIKFYEECNYGYVEAFVYNLLLHSPQIAFSDITLERLPESAGAGKETASENINCYERIDAMLKVYETMKLQRRENLRLVEMFECQKLPSVIMSVANMLRKQGFSTAAIKKSLKVKGYSTYLKVSSLTSPELKKKIFQFKLLPWAFQ